MAGLRVHLFGIPSVFRGDPSSEIELSRQLKALLAYLLLHRRLSHPREVLADVFWGNESEDRARSCLTTALWRLRRVVDADSSGSSFLRSVSGNISLDPSAQYWLDVDCFEQAAHQVLRQPFASVAPALITRLEEVLRLYRGDLLEGFYDDWALAEREHLRLKYHDSLAYLVAYHKHHGAWEESLSAAERLLQNDAVREDIHREVMELYARTGRRSRALRQYELCRAILAREFGAAPMEETEALRERVLRDEVAQSHVKPPRPASTDMSQLIKESRRVYRRLQATMDQFRHVMELIESCGSDGTESTPLND